MSLSLFKQHQDFVLPLITQILHCSRIQPNVQFHLWLVPVFIIKKLFCYMFPIFFFWIRAGRGFASCIDRGLESLAAGVRRPRVVWCLTCLPAQELCREYCRELVGAGRELQGGETAASGAAENVSLGHRKNLALLDFSYSHSSALTNKESIKFRLKSSHHTHSPARLRDITTLWVFLFLSCSTLLQEVP